MIGRAHRLIDAHRRRRRRGRRGHSSRDGRRNDRTAHSLKFPIGSLDSQLDLKKKEENINDDDAAPFNRPIDHVPIICRQQKRNLATEINRR